MPRSTPDARPLVALVLGVGGTVNQGIVKALRAGDRPCRVVGACISAQSAGLYLCDVAYLSPRADEAAFFPWLVDVCRREGVAIVLTGVDLALAAIAPRADELRAATGAVVVTSTPAALELAGDKLALVRWLAAAGLPHPRTVLAANDAGVDELVAAVGLPLFAKPRRGRGSRGALAVATMAELAAIRARPDYLVQELLPDAQGELTVGCFCAQTGAVTATIVMRRSLEAGSTVRAEVVAEPTVAAAAARIAAGLGALGPCNVQLRMRDGVPVCFDVNLRFSSTTPMRERLGFREVEASVRRFALGEEAASVLRPRIGGLALRYWEELYVEPATVAELDRSGRLEIAGAAPGHDAARLGA